MIGAVTQEGKEIGWYQVRYNGTNCYVSSEYLTKTKPGNGTDASKTPEQKSEQKSEQTGEADNSTTVYAEDGSKVILYPAGGYNMFEDAKGRSYVYQYQGMYYCITNDTSYCTDPTYWTYGPANVEGDPYGDLKTGGDDYDDVNIEGDPYGDLKTGGDGYDYDEDEDYDDYDDVNIEGDPYGDLVTGGNGSDYGEDEDYDDYDDVNIEGDPYGDLVTGSDGYDYDEDEA